jgi:hypothetical protein
VRRFTPGIYGDENATLPILENNQTVLLKKSDKCEIRLAELFY